MNHTPMPTRRPRRALITAFAVAGMTLAACSGGDTTNDSQADNGSHGGEDAATTELTVVTHDSFALSDDLLQRFTADTGYEVTWVAPGDGGALVNQLILTKDSPLGDVVYGLDNTFAARAVAEDVFTPYTSPAEPEVDNPFGELLTPIDFGDVCINIDHEWFTSEGLAEPATLDDLIQEEYADLLVVTNPATSSPGLSFLLATIAEYGDGWQDYWRDLLDNGVTIADGWSEAYYVDFSGSEGEGPKPLVLSYSSSPAAEVEADGNVPTGALLDTCFRQTEFAGVLSGAANPAGAEAFIDFLLSEEVQADIPGSMYVYPIRSDVTLPDEWAQYAPVAEEPYELSPEDIAQNRDDWIQEWTELVTG